MSMPAWVEPDPSELPWEEWSWPECSECSELPADASGLAEDMSMPSWESAEPLAPSPGAYSSLAPE